MDVGGQYKVAWTYRDGLNIVVMPREQWEGTYGGDDEDEEDGNGRESHVVNLSKMV